MTYTIVLEEMEFRAQHGCYDLEKQVGNKFLVTLAMDAVLDEAAAEDDVTKTINYLTVYETVEREMKIPSDIIENVALRILDALYSDFPQLSKATVTVSKVAPPLGGKVAKASVTLTK